MGSLYAFLVEIGLTLAVSFVVVIYFRRFLIPVLRDLCGTEARAQFWASFSYILLIGLPLIFGLSFRMSVDTLTGTIFDVAAQLAKNLTGFLIALLGIGFAVGFFALVAPRPSQAEKK